MGLRIGRSAARDLRVSIATTVVAAFSVCTLLSVPLLFTHVVGASSNYTAVPLSASELATNWSPDRTTPSGGYGSSAYAGRDDVLEVRVDTTNASPTTGFYRTEGIQRQIPTSDTIKADLYVDDTWSTKDVRAGLWGVGKSGMDVTAYPIVEFVSGLGAGYTGWRTWNGEAWVDTAAGYNANAWNTLEITLNKTTHQFDILINGSVVASYADDGSDGIGAIIFNSFNAANNDTAFNYAAHWSNVAYGKIVADVPAHLRLNGDKPCGYATNVNYITPTWDAVPGATSYNYKVVTPSGATYGPVSVGNVTSVSGPFGGEGLSTFSVQAVTPYGVSEWADPCAVVYDTVPPEVAVNPIYNTTANKIQPDVTISDDVVSFAWTTSVSPADVTISDPSALIPTFTVHNDGTYEFTLTVKDASENTGTATFTFTYATPIPETINTETIPIVAEVAPFVDVTVTPDTTGTGETTSQSTTILRNTETGAVTDDVLGAQTKKSGEVLGADTAAVIAPTTQGWKILGILWYWWALMIAAVVAIWWFLARRFGTQAQDV